MTETYLLRDAYGISVLKIKYNSAPFMSNFLEKNENGMAYQTSQALQMQKNDLQK